MMEINGVQSKQFVVVKSWHALLTLLAWLVLTVIQFATLRAQTEQNSRDIEHMKQEQVTRDEFKEFHDDVIRRLDRIERKLDAADQRRHP